MSRQTTADIVQETMVADRRSRPYQGYPTWQLVEMLERQLDQAEPFTEGMVIELANRALAAERAAVASH
ncbi:MAG: hypothetical protein ACRDZ4_17040 [Egibacteraceae bacterium]